MRKLSVWMLAGLVPLILLGCVPATSPVPSLSAPGLQIPSMWTSIGMVDGDPGRQTFSYTIVLWNKQTEDVHVNWVEPILSDEFAERARTEDRKVTVDKALAPGDSLEIRGQLRFDVAGLSKAQIEALEPFLTAMRVSTERVLELPVSRGARGDAEGGA